jgi:chemotaxis protein methyltransferase CheR
MSSTFAYRQRAEPLDDLQFEWLRHQISTYGGVHLDPGQRRMLESAVAQRAASLGMDQPHYLTMLAGEPARAELQHLTELVLNHETFFFRNRPHLSALQQVLLPEMHRTRPIGAPIRIWSAGCATGEEAYSIAIVALEVLGTPPSRPVEIIATDLSSSALRKAEIGRYRGRTLQNLSPDLLGRYFEPNGEWSAVSPAVRALVRFQQLNLLDPFPPQLQGVDAIFCQNVTIYFQREPRRQLIERFYACLPPHGLLFLGFSETLWNVFDGFQSREIAGAYVYQKAVAAPKARAPRSQPRQAPAAGAAQPAAPARRPASASPRPRSQPAPQQDDQRDAQVLQEARALLDRGSPSESLDLLRQIAPNSPHAAQALSLAARAHADRGDFELAAAEAIRAIEIDSLHDPAYLLLGVVYARQRQWQAAVQQLERARYLRPEAALVSFHLAAAYAELQMLAQAQREYRSTIWKLRDHAPDALLDGVAVAWLRDTCARQIERLAARIGR